jgi:putative FmdB family regulatory protein
MPIYEYTCNGCGELFERLVRSVSSGVTSVECPECGDGGAERAMSSFAFAGTPTTDTSRMPPGPSGVG